MKVEMKKNVFTVMQMICLVIALAANLIGLFALELLSLTKLTMTASIFVLLFGIMYVLYGCRKNAAVYYQSFMVLYATSCLIDAVGVTQYDTFMLSPLLIKSVVFILIMVLAFGKDLGKNLSVLLGWLLVACNLVLLVLSLFYPGYFGETLDAEGEALAKSTQLRNAGEVFLAISAALMVKAKYADKDSRGAK